MWRVIRVGRSSLVGVTNPEGANPGAGTRPTFPGFGMGRTPGGGTGRCPGGGMSPGFGISPGLGIAEDVVDATAEGSADADGAAAALALGSGAARLPTGSKA